jgi:hypothetical protein
MQPASTVTSNALLAGVRVLVWMNCCFASLRQTCNGFAGRPSVEREENHEKTWKRRSKSAATTVRVGLQLGQLPAAGGAAPSGGQIVRHARQIIFKMAEGRFRESCSGPFLCGLPTSVHDGQQFVAGAL